MKISLFRNKKKVPEVNYFEGGAVWTDYAITLSLLDNFGITEGDLPANVTFFTPIGHRRYAKDYAGVTIAKALPFAGTAEPITAGIIDASVFSGTTFIDGSHRGITLTLKSIGSFKFTYSGCLVNKVFTVTITT